MSQSDWVYIEPALRLPHPGWVARRLNSLVRPARPTSPPGWQPAITAAYGLELLEPPRVMEGGIRSQSWVLQTQRGQKILKRYKGSVPYEQALFEHSVLRRLAVVDFPAPRVNTAGGGETVVTLPDGHYGLFDFIPGAYQFMNYISLPSDQARYLWAVGRSLARLHQALDGFQPDGENINGFDHSTGERGVKLEWYLEKLARCREITANGPPGRSHPASLDLQRRAGWLDERLRSDEAGLRQANPSRGIIHGDYGLYNLMVARDRRLVTLDFEMARLDWRLLDLVFAVSSATRPGPLDSQLAQMRPIVEGYLSACPDLSPELRLVPAVWRFQFLRRVIVAWERYLDSGDEKLLGEVEHRMARVDWLEQHQDAIAGITPFSSK